MIKSEIRNPKSETNSNVSIFENSNFEFVSCFVLRDSNFQVGGLV